MNIGRFSNDEGNENVSSYRNECLFLFLFWNFRVYFNAVKMAYISELPTESRGPHPRFGLREEIELVPVFTSFKQRRKRTFNPVFVQFVRKEKRGARAKLQNYLLIGPVSFDVLIAVVITVAFFVASRIYRCA